ncbi:MAG: hypothetical protein ACRD8U_06635 [Pyrinomonadaceae bacterium]
MTAANRLMSKRILQTLPLLPAVLVILSAAIFASAKLDAEQSQDSKPTTKHNVRPIESTPKPPSGRSKTDADSATYTYEFTQPEFLIRHIVIEHDADGRGKITFERKNEEIPIIESVEISPAALARISERWQALRFLESETNYQASKQFPHLGAMRIGIVQGSRRRTAEFNWTNNDDAFALITEYRRVADQAVFIFDLSVARENQPLNSPKLMEHLESMLKRNWLSDPQQLIPLLRDVSTDEHLPLIARNHALRLIKKIEK